MELKKLFTAEERAVSPVIAVVLMIAVTVILAAVVAAFALGLGGASDSAPQATFDFDSTPDLSGDGATTNDPGVFVTHEGGDPLPEEQVDVIVAGAVTAWPASADETINTGDSNGFAGADGDAVRVVWTGDDGREATLGTYTINL